MNAAILGIGTELTSGQIANRNGQWISGQLAKFGISTSCHLVVPDDKPLMHKALEFCSQDCEMLFVTGGLGPTSDDFTRDVIAEWAKRELKYDEGSWTHIVQRLESRGIAAKQIQKQQCYYPEGAKVLKNNMGTAHGFYLMKEKLHVFVLPGPPREIDAIWKDHLVEWLSEHTKNLDPVMTWSWDLLGEPESEVARLAEEALVGCHFTKAYRVHIPFVEFKLSFLKSQLSEAEKFAHQLNEKFGSKCVAKNGVDLAQQLAKKLDGIQKVEIIDELSQGYLLNRLFPFLRPLLEKGTLSYTSESAKASEKSSAGTLKLHLQPLSSRQAQASMQLRGQKYLQQFNSRFESMLMRDREQQFFAEQALIFWNQSLDSSL